MLKSKTDITRIKTAKRARIVLISLALFTVFLIYNILYLSLFQYNHYIDKVKDEITTTSILKAERGAIYDRNMTPLAVTKTTWRIFISPKEIRKASEKHGVDYVGMISSGLSDILGVDKDKLYRTIKESGLLDVTVKKSASKDEYDKLLNFIKKNKLDDLIFTEAQSSRYYPEGTLAAHTLGFTGSDNQGLYGLEYYYNSTLSGKNGYYMYAKDAGGSPLPGGYAAYCEPIDGNSIVTTLDSYLQSRLEAELERIVLNHDVNNRVAGIVMDAKTGAILAMATSSPFDPNDPYELDIISKSRLQSSGYAEGSDEYKALKTELMQIMWSNKAVSETYEPGSTFKIITVSAALDSGYAKATDTFSCVGYHNVGGWRIKCHKVTGHGSGFKLSYGLQMSCNPTMMTIAERMGSDVFYSYVEKFGYMSKTGIDLPSEASTIFHQKANIGPTELATASFGQRFKVSIIAQLTAIAAVANDGKLVQPYVVERIIDPYGNTVSEHTPIVKAQVISESVAKEVSDILEQGVSGDGGAKNAYVEGYYVAAKTGTSQKFDVLDANGNSYLRIGSTVAFAKSEERSIAMIIVVDEPMTTVKYGSFVAAPYISSYLSDALPYLNYLSEAEEKELTLDNYIGIDKKELAEKMKELGINYKIIGDGDTVTSQIPEAGITVDPKHATVYFYTDKRQYSTISVPNLVGLTLKEASIIATEAGLNVTIKGVNDNRIEETVTVCKQSIIPGDSVPIGTVIELYALKTDFED